jgi:putative ABC transport system substrate-binding protein
LVERRTFIGLCGTVAAWPLVARAASPSRLYRIGFVAQPSPDAPQWTEVINELAGSGFIEGENLIVDRHGLGVGLSQFDEAVVALVNTTPDLIYCGGDVAMQAAARATTIIPVVAVADDYLATGIVSSLAHPGRNFTGVSLFAPELNSKRIELLIDIIPGLHRVAVLADRRVGQEKNLQAIEQAIRPRGIELSLHWVAHESELAAAFRAVQASGAQAVSVLSSPLLHSAHKKILSIVADARLPAIFQWPEYASEGAFASYGPRILLVFRQIGQQMVKILKGARPSDIPIEQPTKFELVINLKTAKALGLTVPQSMLQRADEVIE